MFFYVLFTWANGSIGFEGDYGLTECLPGLFCRGGTIADHRLVQSSPGTTESHNTEQLVLSLWKERDKSQL